MLVPKGMPRLRWQLGTMDPLPCDSARSLFWGNGIAIQNSFHGNKLPVDFLIIQFLMILQ
jgi:hypothetical protein